jgi:hypothetical protein
MKNRKEILRLSFKGERDYLHGTDIFPSLLEVAGEVKDLSIQFHKLTSKVLKAQIVAESDLSKLRSTGKLCVLMTYKQHAKQFFIAVTETTEPITARQPFDEELTIKGANIVEKEIIQHLPTTGSFIERTVALNKKLLNSIVDVHPWLFSRLDLKEAPLDPSSLSLRLTNEFGNRTFHSEITGDGKLLGNIYFSRRIK